ncbi:hypothetical protein T02_12257 [Trichinella nativa]|uniref:Uncharacterized protein n=1 Tax=Trichinella nativa TaxID=6335 RepID=A0A0V1KHK8_9BILA|nr:hypothetical protein T02_12257 [Trichinella nativa]
MISKFQNRSYCTGKCRPSMKLNSTLVLVLYASNR